MLALKIPDASIQNIALIDAITRIDIIKATKNDPLSVTLSGLDNLTWLQNMAFTMGETKGINDSTERWTNALSSR